MPRINSSRNLLSEDKYLKLLSKMQHWISVEDGLPKLNREILIYGIDVGIFIDEYNGYMPIWATHWQYLPELPEEDE